MLTKQVCCDKKLHCYFPADLRSLPENRHNLIADNKREFKFPLGVPFIAGAVKVSDAVGPVAAILGLAASTDELAVSVTVVSESFSVMGVA